VESFLPVHPSGLIVVTNEGWGKCGSQSGNRFCYSSIMPAVMLEASCASAFVLFRMYD
jgi:hypothetical protein